LGSDYGWVQTSRVLNNKFGNLISRNEIAEIIKDIEKKKGNNDIWYAMAYRKPRENLQKGGKMCFPVFVDTGERKMNREWKAPESKMVVHIGEIGPRPLNEVVELFDWFKKEGFVIQKE